MKPIIWGATYWMYLHLISIGYPDVPTDEEKQNMKQFLNIFPETIPCIKCKTHFINTIKNYDLNKMLHNKKSFMEFIWIMHNNVNDLLHKKKIDYNNFLKIYNKALNGSITFNAIYLNNQLIKYLYFNVILLIIIITLIFLTIYLYMKTKS